MKEKSKIIKGRTLFQLMSCIKESKVPWDSLPDMDKKKFSPFLVNRFLSMNIGLLPIVNMLQKYTIGLLKPREVYKLYYDILPKQKTFDKYIKGKSESKHNKELLGYLTKWYQLSEREVVDYLEDMSKAEVDEILQKYGLNDKERKKLMK